MRTKKSIPLRHLISGGRVDLSILRFEGSDVGAPKAYIQAALHAGEIQGIGVVAALSRFFESHPPRGTVTLVPSANPFALDVKMGEYTYGRFDPVTGENWNRQFMDLTRHVKVQAYKDKPWEAFREALCDVSCEGGSYGAQLARTLQREALQADVVIDLHADSRSLHHVYAPQYAAASLAYLGVGFGILTDRVFSPTFNQSCFYPWWTLAETKGEKTPFESMTMELGDKETYKEDQSQHFADNILNYLRAKGVVEGACRPLSEPLLVPEKDFLRLYAPRGGLFDYRAPLGVGVQKGDLLARLLRLDTLSVEDIVAPCNGIPLTYTSSGAVHEGSEILKMLRLA